jgi:hypothetical protein
LVAVHALLSAPSADEEKKSITFANMLSQALRTAGGDFEFLSSVAAAHEKMAGRSAKVDFGMCAQKNELVVPRVFIRRLRQHVTN